MPGPGPSAPGSTFREEAPLTVAVQAAYLSCLPAPHGKHIDLLRTDTLTFSGICFQLNLFFFIYFSLQRGHLQAADSRET